MEIKINLSAKDEFGTPNITNDVGSLEARSGLFSADAVPPTGPEGDGRAPCSLRLGSCFPQPRTQRGIKTRVRACGFFVRFGARLQVI